MQYVLNTKPVIKSVDKLKFFSVRNKLLEGKTLTKSEIELILDFYVGETRKALSDVLNIDIYEDALENKCDVAQKLLGSSLEKVGVIVYPEETHKVIHPEVPGHSFLVAIFNKDDAYLIDPTYRQFFQKDKCDIDRLQMVDDLVYCAPDPGYFASQRDTIRKTASKILETGYIKLDETSAKHYCDTFYFSKRGRGGYTDIPGSVYLNSLLKETHRYSIDDSTLKSRGF